MYLSASILCVGILYPYPYGSLKYQTVKLQTTKNVNPIHIYNISIHWKDVGVEDSKAPVYDARNIQRAL